MVSPNDDQHGDRQRRYDHRVPAAGDGPDQSARHQGHRRRFDDSADLPAAISPSRSTGATGPNRRTVPSSPGRSPCLCQVRLRPQIRRPQLPAPLWVGQSPSPGPINTPVDYWNSSYVVFGQHSYATPGTVQDSGHDHEYRSGPRPTCPTKAEVTTNSPPPIPTPLPQPIPLRQPVGTIHDSDAVVGLLVSVDLRSAHAADRDFFAACDLGPAHGDRHATAVRSTRRTRPRVTRRRPAPWSPPRKPSRRSSWGRRTPARARRSITLRRKAHLVKLGHAKPGLHRSPPRAEPQASVIDGSW